MRRESQLSPRQLDWSPVQTLEGPARVRRESHLRPPRNFAGWTGVQSRRGGERGPRGWVLHRGPTRLAWVTRFALPGGRWRYFMGAALVFIGFLSQSALVRGLAMFDSLGLAGPLRVRVAASPLWVTGCIAVAMLSIIAARVVGHRRYASAWVLVSTTLLLLAAAVFTFWSALAISCAPIGELCCMGPIR
jgi:hypothetical protein